MKQPQGSGHQPAGDHPETLVLPLTEEQRITISLTILQTVAPHDDSAQLARANAAKVIIRALNDDFAQSWADAAQRITKA
uniref:Uncharacterized protein n=1 Tax=mine drainage metagenome TaxID=410659 RepID=E6QP63_9ZZZZ